MVVFTPLAGALAMGGLNGVLNIFGSVGQNAAARQDYMNQRAQQSANARFAQWQAAFTQRYSDANQQYQFWQSTLGYNQQLAYVNSLRNFELAKAASQAEVV